MKSTALSLTCSLLLFAAPSIAEDMGLYVGGSLGSTSLALGNNYLDQEFDDIDLDEDTSAWKAYAGVQFLPFISLEGGYVSFGQVDDTSPTVAAELETETMALFARGILPVGPLQVFGKVGYHFYDADVSLQDITNAVTRGDSVSGQDLAIGAGAGIEFGALTLRAEYEVFLVEDLDDLTMISVGASYSF